MMAVRSETEYELNARITKKMADGPFPLQLTLSLERAGADTKATGHIEMQPGGFFAIAEPFVAGNLRQHFEGDMASLKRELEKTA